MRTSALPVFLIAAASLAVAARPAAASPRLGSAFTPYSQPSLWTAAKKRAPHGYVGYYEVLGSPNQVRFGPRTKASLQTEAPGYSNGSVHKVERVLVRERWLVCWYFAHLEEPTTRPRPNPYGQSLSCRNVSQHRPALWPGRFQRDDPSLAIAIEQPDW